MAVLTDEQADWRPHGFGYDLWGCKVAFEFPMVKLLDYVGKEAELEAHDNPFAVVVLAHLKSLETKASPKSRRTWKMRLVRGLYQRGLNAEQVRQLFMFIDWVMDLPKSLEESFKEEFHEFEEEQRMPYVSSIERLAKEEGREEGRREGLLDTIQAYLKLRFSKKGLQLLPKIRKVADLDALRAIRKVVETADDLEEIRECIP